MSVKQFFKTILMKFFSITVFSSKFVVILNLNVWSVYFDWTANSQEKYSQNVKNNAGYLIFFDLKAKQNSDL